MNSIKTTLSNLGWTFNLIWKSAGTYSLMLLAINLVDGLIPTLQIWAISRVVDSIILEEEYFFYIIILGSLLLISKLILILQMPIKSIFENLFKSNVKELLVEKLYKLSFIEIDSANFRSEFDLVQDFASKLLNTIDTMISFVRSSITFIGVLIISAYLDYKIAIVVLIGCLPLVFVSKFITHKSHDLQIKLHQFGREGGYYQRLLTHVNMAKEIKLFNLGDLLSKRWLELRERQKKEMLSLSKKQALLTLLCRIISVISYLVALILLINQLFSSKGSIGTFVGVSSAIMQFQNSLKVFIDSSTRLLSIEFQANGLRGFLQKLEGDNNEQLESKGHPVTLNNSIQFDDVSFCYPNQKETITNVSFEINVGDKIAIIGENGSGKTTIIKLLMGLLTPTSGKIYVDGLDVRGIDDKNNFIKLFSGVFQEYLRYQLSIRENIGFGDINKLQDEILIKKMMWAVGLNELMNYELSDGIDSILGRLNEGDRELSGGQWQRIAIARALLKKAEIFIFDEPTSDLDPISEIEVFHQISELTQDKTVIFISHRVGIAKQVDKVFVLKDGRLIESGTHDELLSIDNEYARLFNSQATWYC